MKVFYGWKMVAAAFGIQFMIAAVLTQSLGLYIAVLADEMGWSKTTLSGAAALQSVESAIIGPIMGWLMDRFGPQVMIRWGVVALSAGLFLLSQVSSVTTFYVSAVMMAIGASLSGYFPLSVALVQWFEKHRARALSMMTLGMALGGLIVPLVAWSMQHWGWRETAVSAGVLALLVGLPLSGVIRRRPQDHGEHVDGVAPQVHDASSGAGQPAPGAQHEFTVAQAIRTRAFWLLAIGHGLALLVVTAVNVHAISHMKEGLGYSVATAGWVVMWLTFGQVAGILLGAAIGDRFVKRKVAAFCMVSHAVGLLLLTYSTSMAGLLAFTVFHGVAWGLRGPFMQAIRADYFGRMAIGQILGISSIVLAVGQVAGPLVAGVLADMTGDYRLGFTVLALISAMGSVAFMQATKPPAPRP
jgi:MFS family permease